MVRRPACGARGRWGADLPGLTARHPHVPGPPRQRHLDEHGADQPEGRGQPDAPAEPGPSVAPSGDAGNVVTLGSLLKRLPDRYASLYKRGLPCLASNLYQTPAIA